MFNIFKTLSNRQFKREAERLRPLVEQVNGLEPEMQAYSDRELADLTAEFRERLPAADDQAAHLERALDDRRQR